MIALGYPNIESRPKLIRDLAKMIHYDDSVLDGFRTIEEVKAFTKRASNWNLGPHRWKPETH